MKNIFYKFFLIIILWIGICTLFVLSRLIQEKSLSTYGESWILVGSRGHFGNIDKLELTNISNKKYLFELIGDTSYQRGDLSKSLIAYEKALEIEKDAIIELKIALLKNEKSQDSSGKTSLSGAVKEMLENTLDRIQKNESDRGKYLGNGQTYSQIPPSFQAENTEVIDW